MAEKEVLSTSASPVKITKAQNVRGMAMAHDLEDSSVERTADIKICEDVDFKGLLLHDNILSGLHKANFQRPSPIQLRAIPLARCGFDLIVQAKAGTGKTLVIGVAALEAVNVGLAKPQVLVIAPTREIALQVRDVINSIGTGIAGLNTETFIGGLVIKDDRARVECCQIVVGTPGRLKDLTERSILSLSSIRLLVMDEADKLTEDVFRHDLRYILKKMPGARQTILCSATFDDSLSKFVKNYMRSPMWVSPESAVRVVHGKRDAPVNVSTVLLGVKQFVKEVSFHSNIVKQLKYKTDELLKVLSGVPFSQCIIFSNYHSRAESLCHKLTSHEWPAISICGKDDQKQRMSVISLFRKLHYRVLVSTDLTARGIDIPGVNLVVNLDVPYDAATYLHRIGRAGRFGSHGLVVTLASAGKEVDALYKIIQGTGSVLYSLPDDLSLLSSESLKIACFGSARKDKEGESGDCLENNNNVTAAEDDIELDSFRQIISEGIQSDAKICVNFNSGPEKSSNCREDVSVKRAKEHVMQVIREMQPAQAGPVYAFDELEKMLENWDPKSKQDISAGSSAGCKKRPDWWSSAEVVLAAADKQLQDLKLKHVVDSSVGEHSEESCSSLGSNIATRTAKKNKTQLVKLQENGRKHKSSYSDSKNSKNQNDEWQYDPVTKRAYCWESERNFWWELDPRTDTYVCCDMASKMFYRWNSHDNTLIPIQSTNNKGYNIMDSEAGPSEHHNKSSFGNEHANGYNVNTSVQRYSDWFNSWINQLHQIRTYVQTVEYWRGMGGSK